MDITDLTQKFQQWRKAHQVPPASKDDAVKTYQDFLEREFVKQGLALLSHYERLRKASELLIEEKKVVQQELLALSKQAEKTIPLETGETLVINVASGERFQNLLQTIQKTLGQETLYDASLLTSESDDLLSFLS